VRDRLRFETLAPGFLREHRTRTLWTLGRTRKLHACEQCGAETPKGGMMYRPLNEQDGVKRYWRLCRECAS
jgi:hypothetical protein